jgi:hypothetical protein
MSLVFHTGLASEPWFDTLDEVQSEASEHSDEPGGQSHRLSSYVVFPPPLTEISSRGRVAREKGRNFGERNKEI